MKGELNGSKAECAGMHSGVTGPGEGKTQAVRWWDYQAMESLRPRSRIWPAGPVELALIGCSQHCSCLWSVYVCVCVWLWLLYKGKLLSSSIHWQNTLPSISSNQQADHGGMPTGWSIHHKYQKNCNHVIIFATELRWWMLAGVCFLHS